MAKKNTEPALGEHIFHITGHRIEYEEVKVIVSESKTKHMKVVEAIHIGPGPPSSTGRGYDLLCIYTPLLKDLKKGGGGAHVHQSTSDVMGMSMTLMHLLKEMAACHRKVEVCSIF